MGIHWSVYLPPFFVPVNALIENVVKVYGTHQAHNDDTFCLWGGA